jgi:hypothetical protein
VWGFLGFGGALAVTRSGNTNVPCEPIWWGHVRVAGSKIPRMVRHSGHGNRSARGHGTRERERHGKWAYDDSYIIGDENDQLSANWEGRKTRHVKG